MAEALLVIEDEPLLGAELVRHYEREGWEAALATTLAEARALVTGGALEPVVVLSDMSLPDGNALDLLEELRGAGEASEWILLTGYGGVPDSVRALRLGAFDFLEKPCEQSRLDVVVHGAARSAQAQRRLREQASAGVKQFGVGSFVGRSNEARAVRSMLTRLASVPFSALIVTGETGTGKGLATRILHHTGPRAAEPLVEVNCAALPKDLLESELFGHEAGAFTGAKSRRRGLFEQAHGGTLFLDEISEMELDLQAKLLSAIEDREIRRLGGEKAISVDVRIVAASNRDLDARVLAGEFRRDLYHRLSAFQLRLPTLRERIEDLDELVPSFVAEFNAVAGKRVTRIDEPVWSALRAHGWPGNIRELRNVTERCVLFAENEAFPVRWLQLDQAAPPRPSVGGDDHLSVPLDGSMTLEEAERAFIERMLERNGGNVTAAARALGTSREKLRYRVSKYGLGEDLQRGT